MAKRRKQLSKKGRLQNARDKRQERQFFKIAIIVTIVVLVLMYFIFQNINS